MTQPHEIIIEILPDGTLKATVNGIDGPACGDVSKLLDQLGIVVEDMNTDDYYNQASTGLETHLGAGY